VQLSPLIFLIGRSARPGVNPLFLFLVPSGTDPAVRPGFTETVVPGMHGTSVKSVRRYPSGSNNLN